MNLEDLGNIGEFVGAIAVVISIIYLAVQVRRNTQSLDATIDDTYVELYLRWTDTFSTLETSRLMLKGFNEPASLSDDESVQFAAHLVRFVMLIDCLESMYALTRTLGSRERRHCGISRDARWALVVEWKPRRIHSFGCPDDRQCFANRKRADLRANGLEA